LPEEDVTEELKVVPVQSEKSDVINEDVLSKKISLKKKKKKKSSEPKKKKKRKRHLSTSSNVCS